MLKCRLTLPAENLIYWSLNVSEYHQKHSQNPLLFLVPQVGLEQNMLNPLFVIRKNNSIDHCNDR